MGGNTALQSGRRLQWVKGIILMTPFDPSYYLLHGMEDKKYLTVYEKEVGGKVRKYYSITKTGRKVLEEKKEEWKIYSSAVVNVLNAAVC